MSRHNTCITGSHSWESQHSGHLRRSHGKARTSSAATAQLGSIISHGWVQLPLASGLCHLSLPAATREASSGRRGTSVPGCQGSGPVSRDRQLGTWGRLVQPSATSLQAELAWWLQQLTRGHLQGEVSRGWSAAGAAGWLGRTPLSTPEKVHLPSLIPPVNSRAGIQIQFGPTPKPFSKY